jgi:hypothetical protein
VLILLTPGRGSHTTSVSRMTFRAIRLVPHCWSRRFLRFLLLWLFLDDNMIFSSSHRVMALVGSHQKLPALTCFLRGSESLTAARWQGRLASFSAAPAFLGQSSPSRAFHTISAKTTTVTTTTRLLAYPQQRRSFSDDESDSVPKDIYIPEDQLDFSFVRSSVSRTCVVCVEWG